MRIVGMVFSFSVGQNLIGVGDSQGVQLDFDSGARQSDETSSGTGRALGTLTARQLFDVYRICIVKRPEVVT